MKNIINFQPKRFDKITFTKNMNNCFRNLLTKTTLWRVNSFYFKQKVAKCNSPMKNLEIKGSKARLDCTFKITEVNFFPVFII